MAYEDVPTILMVLPSGLAKELANAKDIQGVMTLQGQYAQTQLQSYGRQAHELGRLIAEAVESMKIKS